MSQSRKTGGRLAWVGIGLALLLPALAAGCFAQRSGIIEKDAVAYLRFSGSTGGARFRVEQDGKEVRPASDVDPDRVYSATPGAYLIVVEKGGTPVVRRRVLLSDEQTLEVRIP